MPPSPLEFRSAASIIINPLLARMIKFQKNLKITIKSVKDKQAQFSLTGSDYNSGDVLWAWYPTFMP